MSSKRLHACGFLTIREIPDAISGLVNLRELSLWGNKISKISSSFAKLAHLEDLDLSRNQISIIPDSILKVSSLERLHLENNKIREIPDEIAQLTNLSWLYLYSNEIREIPNSISQLVNLQELSLYSNQIREMPEALFQLPNLQDLHLFSNEIRKIPESISQLVSLENLSLSLNQITHIPDGIGQLSNLQKLDLSNNQIEKIPKSLTQLSNLLELDLRNNLLPIPPDILENYEKPRVIFNYGQEPRILDQVIQDRTNAIKVSESNPQIIGGINKFARFQEVEAKVILVRHEAVVKTSLLESMRRFELCFPIQSRSNYPIYIIPEFLPEEEPDTGTWHYTLRFEYHYKVLFSSVISRFIIKMNHCISKHTYWRTGVILCSKEDNRAYIRADLANHKILINIDGNVSTRRIFLGAISSTFDAIHYSYKNFSNEVNRYVPLPDNPKNPVEYEYLLKLEKMGETKYIPKDSDRDYNIRELLDGIEDRRERDQKDDKT